MDTEPNIEVSSITVTPQLAEPPPHRRLKKLLSRGADAGFPSEPVLGRLPLARLIPQDVHSLGDYTGALGAGLVAASAGGARAKAAGLLLALSGVGVSLVTDYRLSLRKWIPIEKHEVIDYAWGAMTAASPWLFGYARRAPAVAWAQVAIGLGYWVVSALTDYRGQVGAGRGHRPVSTGPVSA